MDPIFMNDGDSKTCDSHRLSLNCSIYEILAFTMQGRDLKRSRKAINLKYISSDVEERL